MKSPAQVTYLIAFPDPVESSPEPQETIRGLKDAPYFQPVDIAVRTLPASSLQVGDTPVGVTCQRYDDRIQMVECRFHLPDLLSATAREERDAIEDELLAQFVPQELLASGLYEEYFIVLLGKVAGIPDKFIDRHAAALAQFFRSHGESMIHSEIENTLSSRVRYSKDDLTMVDWEGAVIIAPDGDFQSDIELLKVGNYQLLRYRMLDQSVDHSLQDIARKFRAAPNRPLRVAPARRQIRRIVQHRLELALDFEYTDQNLLLIGDWYTSKLYRVIRNELYLDNWKDAVKSKLVNLEDILGTIRENFSLSWSELMGQVELAGWLILLIGYFILFFIDMGVITKP
jgi:hypothetical protein